MESFAPNLTDTQTLKRILQEHAIVPARSQGQNFLVWDKVRQVVVQELAGEPKQVTELGSGLGTLTQALVMNGFTVRAIEQDDQLAPLIIESVPSEVKKNIEIVHEDLRETSWEWGGPYVLVGNIPYNLSGFIFRRLTELSSGPSKSIFLIQKEVALRIMAHPPSMNLLGLSVQLYGTPKLLLEVPLNSFWPQPTVSSSLISVIPHSTPLVSRDEFATTMRLARYLFQGKRKQIAGRLSDIATKEDIEKALRKVNILPTARPQELSISTWIELARILDTSLS